MSMIPVKFDQLVLSNAGFVVLLKNPDDKRSLPIFIGAAEAQAIAIRIEGVQVPRPLTHDLLKNMLDFFECRLKRIEICDLVEGTFYAKLIIERDGAELEIDSRPSDAIALALRCASPIYVAEKVMDEAGRVLDETTQAGQQAGHAGKSHAPKKELSPLEMLKESLNKAITEERYEDAAQLRDEIRRIENPQPHN